MVQCIELKVDGLFSCLKTTLFLSLSRAVFFFLLELFFFLCLLWLYLNLFDHLLPFHRIYVVLAYNRLVIKNHGS